MDKSQSGLPVSKRQAETFRKNVKIMLDSVDGLEYTGQWKVNAGETRNERL